MCLFIVESAALGHTCFLISEEAAQSVEKEGIALQILRKEGGARIRLQKRKDARGLQKRKWSAVIECRRESESVQSFLFRWSLRLNFEC